MTDVTNKSENGPSEAAMDIALTEAGFVHGAQSCREMLARFVENSPPTDLKVLANSMRANWHPGWGADPGPLTGPIPDNPLGHLALDIELLDIEREADQAKGSHVADVIGANGQPVKLLTIAGREVEVDAEIAPLVRAFNSIGLETVASCSGHGIRPGNIALRDGREIIIARNFEEARTMEAALSERRIGR